jgi:hypothetical protein
MSDNRATIVALGVGLAAVLLADSVLVWPNVRDASTAREEIAGLQPLLADLYEQAEDLEDLAYELLEKRERLAAGRRTTTARAASPQAVLARLADAWGDAWTDVRPTPRATSDPAAPGALSEPIHPVTIRVETTFDSIFALIRQVERMDEPVRVARVRIAGGDADRVRTPTALAAAIDLEISIPSLDGEDDTR